MAKKRIIVGPETVVVKIDNFTLKDILTDSDYPEQALLKAEKVYKQIYRLVSFLRWEKHIYKMRQQRQLAALIANKYPNLKYKGPNNIISSKNWNEAKYGDYIFLPRAIINRVIKLNRI